LFPIELTSVSNIVSFIDLFINYSSSSSKYCSAAPFYDVYYALWAIIFFNIYLSNEDYGKSVLFPRPFRCLLYFLGEWWYPSVLSNANLPWLLKIKFLSWINYFFRA
jgi:hypothetical protein